MSFIRIYTQYIIVIYDSTYFHRSRITHFEYSSMNIVIFTFISNMNNIIMIYVVFFSYSAMFTTSDGLHMIKCNSKISPGTPYFSSSNFS